MAEGLRAGLRLLEMLFKMNLEDAMELVRQPELLIQIELELLDEEHRLGIEYKRFGKQARRGHVGVDVVLRRNFIIKKARRTLEWVKYQAPQQWAMRKEQHEQLTA